MQLAAQRKWWQGGGCRLLGVGDFEDPGMLAGGVAGVDLRGGDGELVVGGGEVDGDI